MHLKHTISCSLHVHRVVQLSPQSILEQILITPKRNAMLISTHSFSQPSAPGNHYSTFFFYRAGCACVWLCVCTHVCVCVWVYTQLLNRIQLFGTPWTGSSVHGILWQGYWSALPWPPPGDLPNPRTEPTPPVSPYWQGDSLPLSAWKSLYSWTAFKSAYAHHASSCEHRTWFCTLLSTCSVLLNLHPFFFSFSSFGTQLK